MKQPPVAVTGAGIACSLGVGFDACVRAMFDAPPSPAPPRRFRLDVPGPPTVFEAGDGAYRRGETKNPSTPTARLALGAVREAFGMAGLDAEARQGLRIGVALGTTVGATMNHEEFYREYAAGGEPEMAPVATYLAANPAALAARELGLAGPVATLTNACSSGSDAIGLAADWVRHGLCDAAVAGGADALFRGVVIGFNSLMIASRGACRPFDVRRDGLNLGEGAGVVVLESEELRKKRRARPLGRLAGYGSALDAHHLTAPRPDGAGLASALGRALGEAGIAPGDLAFVNAHGTGTRENDRVEGRVLARELPRIPYFSTKGMTGHTLGAAGGVEAVLSLACLARGRIPASAGFSEADPEIPAPPVSRETEVKGAAAASFSLGFGGVNGVLVFTPGGD